MAKKDNSKIWIALIIAIGVIYLFSNGKFNLGSGVDIPSDVTLCYQETANVPSFCGGLATGHYMFYTDGTTDALWKDPALTVDGNWGTFGHNEGYHGAAILDINYSKPSNAVGAVWQVSSSYGLFNYTIPSDCWNTFPDVLSLEIRSDSATSAIRLRCNAGLYPSQYVISDRNAFPNYIYEEGIYWMLSTVAPTPTPSESPSPSPSESPSVSPSPSPSPSPSATSSVPPASAPADYTMWIIIGVAALVLMVLFFRRD